MREGGREQGWSIRSCGGRQQSEGKSCFGDKTAVKGAGLLMPGMLMPDQDAGAWDADAHLGC